MHLAMNSMNSNYNYRGSFGVLVLIALFSTGCRQNSERKKEEPDQDQYKIAYVRKAEKFNENVIGERLDVADYIKNSLKFELGNKLVLIMVQGSDCSGCRELAYKTGLRINNLHDESVVLVSGVRIKEGFEKSSNSMNLPFVNDSMSVLKSKLSLFHSPSLVLLDSSLVVHDILSLFPFDDVGHGYDQEQEIVDFISNVTFMED